MDIHYSMGMTIPQIFRKSCTYACVGDLRLCGKELVLFISYSSFHSFLSQSSKPPMAHGIIHSHLPRVLVVCPPESFSLYQSRYSHKFHFLKAWETSLPLDQFLSTHARNVQAMLSCGISPIKADLLCHLPSLRLVVTPSSGLNHIDLSECRRRGVAVAYAGSVASCDVADLAVGLLIDVLRKISVADRYVKQGLWASKTSYPIPLGSKVFICLYLISIF